MTDVYFDCDANLGGGQYQALPRVHRVIARGDDHEGLCPVARGVLICG